MSAEKETPSGTAKQQAERLKAEWLKAERQNFQGWDFSHLEGRMLEEPLHWDYDALVRRHLRPHHALLDMGTGGGEYLLTLGHPSANTSVTEAWPPNVALCKEKLAPLGITVRPAEDDARLPYEDDAFDIILNRHEAFVPGEVWRLLRPGGFFITQQVGGQNNVALSAFLLPGFTPSYPQHDLAHSRTALQKQGFAILEAIEQFPALRFTGADALVTFAKIIEWEFPGFSVEASLEPLLALHQQVARQGCIQSREHRFFLVCQKPSVGQKPLVKT